MTSTTIDLLSTGETCGTCGEDMVLEVTGTDELSLGCGCSCASTLS